MSSLVFAFSLAKSTSAWNALMSPLASACAWADSRHQAGFAVVSAPGVPGSGSCALKRKATSKKAGGLAAAPAPPGWVALRVAAGSRYFPLVSSHRPTPAASRTVPPPGSHSLCGTSTVIWRRARSTETVGAGPATGSPLAASVSTAVSPWTVRKYCAGALTLAENGNGCGSPSVPPIAIAVATSAGSSSVFSVMRKAVAFFSGLTRSSTRSAAFSS